MTVVSAFCVGHGPGLLAWPERPSAEIATPMFEAYREVGERLRTSRPEVIVIFTAEHFANFFSIRPSMYINIGDRTHGPQEAWLGAEPRTVPGHPDLAVAMLQHSFDHDFDLAYGHDLLLDHGTIVPLDLLSIDRSLPVIPVIVNGLVEPMAPLRRYASWGESLRKLFEQRPERIAVLGAGGLSHWPGMPEQGQVSEVWDQAVLDGLVRGDRSVVEVMPAAGRTEAGPGAEELRAWAVAVCASGSRSAEVLNYAAVPEWGGGIAVVDLCVGGS